MTKKELEEEIRRLKNIIVQMSYDIENKDVRLQIALKTKH